MADQPIQKKLLEEILGLHRNGIKSGFDQETVDIVWDIVNENYESVREHPLITEDSRNRATWPEWVLFLVVNNKHAAIWAIEAKHLDTFLMIKQPHLSQYDVGKCIKENAIVHRFRVVERENDRHYVEADEILGKQPEFHLCLYIGVLAFSLRGIKAIMAKIARHNFLQDQTDSLGFCEGFVRMYFQMINKEMSPDEVKILEGLTVTINALSAERARSGRQNPTALGWSTIAQVYIVVIGASFLLYGVLKSN